MIPRRLILLVILTATFLSTRATSAAPGPAVTLDSSAVPLVQKYCAGCHNEKTRKAKFRIDDIQPPTAHRADVTRWEKVLEMVSIGDMPPDDKPQPTRVEREQLIAWIKAEFAKLGKRLDDSAHALPHYANRIDHTSLFSGEHKGPAYTSSRVWRVSPHIYDQMLRDLSLNDFTVPLTKLEGEAFDDYALLYADEATLGTLIQNAKRTAVTLVHGRLVKPRGAGDKKRDARGQRVGARHRAFIDFVKLESTPTQEQMQEAVRYAFDLLLLRSPTDVELERYVAHNLAPNVKAGGPDAGLRGMLTSILISPEYLFRMEIGLGERLPDGRRMLSPNELAYALSYALHDHPIDDLLKAAADGRLKTRRDVEREVRKVLTERKLYRGQIPAARRKETIWPVGKLGMASLANPRMLRFFREFFDYGKAPDVFKDDSRHGGKHNPKSLVLDADWLVLSVLSEDKQVFERLLTTDQYMLGRGNGARHGKNVGYLAVYNLTEPNWVERGPTPMPEGQRAGILTHPAWLVAHSGNFENDPVRRGKWIQERLLGGIVPEIPIGVEAQLPEKPKQTLRQRFEIVNAESCWRCHKKMNPLGNPFEAYDDFGRFRTKHHVTENGHVVASDLEVNRGRNTPSAEPRIAVDTTGYVKGTGDAALDGEVKDAIDLAHRLAKSPRVRQMFIRHMFRFWMGRNETLNDSPTLMAMDKAYTESDGSFSEALVALLTSDSFLYRK